MNNGVVIIGDGVSILHCDLSSSGIDGIVAAPGAQASLIDRVTISGQPMNTNGINLANGNGHEVTGCRISGAGTGPVTGVLVQNNDCLVIGNRMRRLLGPAVIDNGANNLIGPIVNFGNFGPNCDPCANFEH